MRFRPKQPRFRRRCSLAIVLSAAALVISGCSSWGQVYPMSDTTKLLLLNKPATNRLILFCSQGGRGWGSCGLDVIRVACGSGRPPGLTDVDCSLISEPNLSNLAIDMGEAMSEVENTPDCLGVFILGGRNVDWHDNPFCAP
jgi:hypothetical protein